MSKHDDELDRLEQEHFDFLRGIQKELDKETKKCKVESKEMLNRFLTTAKKKREAKATPLLTAKTAPSVSAERPVIGNDDILNLQIELGRTMDVQDFINSL